MDLKVEIKEEPLGNEETCENFEHPSIIVCLKEETKPELMEPSPTQVYQHRFLKVTQMFPVRGHSFLPCDQHFAVMETMKRRVETMEMYEGWVEVIKKKCPVYCLEMEEVIDFKEGFKTYFKSSITKDKERFCITKYKLFKFDSSHVNDVSVDKIMSGLMPEYFRILKPNMKPIILECKAYNKAITIQQKKLDDVRSLMKYLQPHAVKFIRSLVGSDEPCNEDQDRDYGTPADNP